MQSVMNFLAETMNKNIIFTCCDFEISFYTEIYENIIL